MLKINSLMECNCHCIKCHGVDLDSKRVGQIESDGYYSMHHTCKSCNTHFDHLEGEVFDACDICNYSNI